MRIRRLFTRPGSDPFESVDYKTVVLDIRGLGQNSLERRACEFPVKWSQTACEIFASKYFRHTNVPAITKKIDEPGLPSWLSRREPDLKKLELLDYDKRFGCENSIRQTIARLVGFWTYWGWKLGYFTTEEDAKAFYDELVYALLTQKFSPSTPQWLNAGLFWAYGISNKTEGRWCIDPQTLEPVPCPDSYERPQLHACFIQSLDNSLLAENGILELLSKQASVFKFGSGSGTNYSNLISKYEKIQTGFKSPGVVNFVALGDSLASSIISGGIARRPAKMAILDCDHPDIFDFIFWKPKEELKSFTLKAGQTLIEKTLCSNSNLGDAFEKLRSLGLADVFLRLPKDEFSVGNLAGQSCNVSIRLSDEFINSVLKDLDWTLNGRGSEPFSITLPATRLWNSLCWSAWFCGDPGVMFQDTIASWNTAQDSEEIRASNPCAEFLFLDDTACNLASLNLEKFFDGNSFAGEEFVHLCSLITIALDISVSAASYPSKSCALKTNEFRPLGLGFTNLGGVLMKLAIPYDSDYARALAAGVSALMTGSAYATSVELAKRLEPFKKYSANLSSFKKVFFNHYNLANYNPEGLQGLNVKPYLTDLSQLPSDMQRLIKQVWERAREGLVEFGVRNSQVTSIAPTGTISLILDADTTGIEPEWSLVKFKKLLDGGTIKIVNKQFLKGLEVLDFSKEQIEEIEAFIIGHKTLVGAPHINHSTLFELGFSEKELDLIESLILKSNSLYEVFNKDNFPIDFQRSITDGKSWAGDNLLELLGFSKEQIEECNKYCFGHDSLDGCPFLTEDQKRIFLTSVGPGPTLDPLAHLKMVAAVQPFISGGISKTVNLPSSASVEDVEKIFLEAWKLGLKSVTIYRDQSKVAQPLNLNKAEVQGTEQHYSKPSRKPLPPKRRGYTQKVKIGGYSIFLRTGEYENGDLGEIFLDISKEGTALGSIMNHFAIAVSIGLQYGVPLEEFVDAFLYTRYEPSGIVQGHPHIKFATSISDFIFKDLAINYLDRKDLIQSSEAQVVDDSIKKDLLSDTRIFEGQPCPECGHFTLIRSGSCLRCLTCGLSKDCS